MEWPRAVERVTEQEIDDRIAIRELLLRYARGVDARDLALVASCFTPDAGYRGALACGTIGDALAALPGAMGRYAATRHLITGQVIELDGDVARSNAECTAQHWLPNGDCRTVGVRYRDDLVRGPEGWRITRREVEELWTRGRAAVGDG
jgi:3-phenylpropionate/cinnamic acid dioxygenase small subunit